MDITEQIGIIKHMWRLAGYVQKRLQTTDFDELLEVHSNESKDVRDAKLKFMSLLYRYESDKSNLVTPCASMKDPDLTILFEDCTRPELDMAVRLWERGMWQLEYEQPDGTRVKLNRVVDGKRKWRGGRPVYAKLGEKRLFGLTGRGGVTLSKTHNNNLPKGGINNELF